MNVNLLRSKKAVSPVVASIILIDVTVAVSIAVAAWMGLFTFSFRNWEIQQYIVKIPEIANATHCQWVITEKGGWSEIIPLPCNATFHTSSSQLTLQIVYYRLIEEGEGVYILQRLTPDYYYIVSLRNGGIA